MAKYIDVGALKKEINDWQDDIHANEPDAVYHDFVFDRIRDIVDEQETVNVPQWISVKERLPEAETRVLVLADRRGRKIITTGMYEDGTIDTENSCWNWYDFLGDYDEENDCYIIQKGWWEDKEYHGDDEYNHPIDDFVTHWMPLPEPPKEEK